MDDETKGTALAAKKLSRSESDLLDDAIAANDGKPLSNVSPIALRVVKNPEHGFDKNMLTARDAFTLQIIVSPVFAAGIVKAGARALTGGRTFAVSTSGSAIATNRLLRIADFVNLSWIYPADSPFPALIERNMGLGVHDTYQNAQTMTELLHQGIDPHGRMSDEKIESFDLRRRFHQAAQIALRTSPLGYLAVSKGKGQLFFKVATAGSRRNPLVLMRRSRSLINEGYNLSHLPVSGDERPPTAVPAWVAFNEVQGARNCGIDVYADDDLEQAEQYARKVTRRRDICLPVLGSPGLYNRVFFDSSWKSVETPVADRNEFTRHDVAHPDVVDALRRVRSRPARIEGLWRYQEEMVGLHLSTERGVVNCCAPGLGKTVMTLAAVRTKAEKNPAWRGLCVAPNTIISQWVGEAERFFPEAIVVRATSGKIAPALAEADAQSGKESRPVLVVASYENARKHLGELAARSWDDLVLDEAAILANGGSARSKAMWELRAVSKVALALTGTPIDKSINDFGRIIAWAYNERGMFDGPLSLARRYKMTDEQSVALMWRDLGAVAFRRDRSEISDQLPETSAPTTVILDPSAPEKALSDGARNELRRYYDQMVDAVDAIAALNPDDPALPGIRSDLRHARGSVLGGITLARAACCDPRAVAASKSAGAELLDHAGLVQPALEQGGTKRAEVLNLVQREVSRGERVLVFTDFTSVCKGLVEDLNTAGVRAGSFSGADSSKAREANVTAFMDGDLDCLVLTGAGREGLNLQNATLVVHYDLPWVPSQLVQRVGRASRIGSTAAKLRVIIPILAGTIEERVAAILVPRAAVAMLALDVHRGAKAADTEMGQAIGNLSEAVSDEERADAVGLFEMAEKILAA